MASVGADDGSEDVNDFLARIKELGDKRDREDEERTRKLEEEIIKGRQERAARRAERARSISPTKELRSSVTSSSASPATSTASPALHKPNMSHTAQPVDASESPAPVLEPSKPNPPPQSPLSRSSTLSWQQRPSSRTSNNTTVRSRPLSVVATENSAFRSPTATPEPSGSDDLGTLGANGGVQDRGTSPSTQRPASNVQSATGHPMAPMFADKDPSWFKQTADRGKKSAAYRKSEEPLVLEQSSRGAGIRMPGMSRESTVESEPEAQAQGSAHNRPGSRSGTASVALDAIRLDPPVSSSEVMAETSTTISSLPGRATTERSDRPASPTKGLGGFVQSAMLKRSDSVSKRWSTQASGSLSRGNSTAGNRASQDLGASTAEILSASSTNLASVSEKATSTESELDSQVINANANTANTQAGGSSLTRTNPSAISTSRPSSPTKDTKRWSPVKTSWLENKINQPDSPKPIKTSNQQQPAWMAELQKSKAARASVDVSKSFTSGVDASRTATSASSQTSILRSARPASVVKLDQKPSLPDKPAQSASTDTSQLSNTSPASEVKEGHSSEEAPLQEESGNSAERQQPPVPTKPKPATPPKKDFRSTLKARNTEAAKLNHEVPEFKKAFGNLKRAETKNYKAPDTLRENITRGKAALNVTEGPQQTKRVDEFKESILAKKKEFSTAPSAPITRNPSQIAEKPVPEALARRTGMLSRTKSISESSSAQAAQPPPVVDSKKPEEVEAKVLSHSAAPVASQIKNSALAARFNPNLAGLLAKGPPSASSGSSRSPEGTTISSGAVASAEVESKGPELMHATKGRARGPKRKLPKTMQASVPESGQKEATTHSASVAKLVTSLPADSTEDKMKSYNDIKAALIGETSTVEALAAASPEKPAARSLNPQNQIPTQSPHALLTSDKSKPLPPKSSSTRVVGGAKTSNPTVQAAENLRSEPLTTMSDTNNRANPNMSPQTPLKKASLDDGQMSPSLTPTSTARTKSPPVVMPKKIGFASTPRNDGAPRTPVKPVDTSSPESTSLKASKSPLIPTKPTLLQTQTPGAEKQSLATATTAKSAESESAAKQVIQEFFGPFPAFRKSRPDIDTQAILTTRASSEGKIKSLRRQIWELLPDGKRMPLAAQQEHILYEDSMYICSHVFGSATGKHTTEAYLWVGDGVSPSSIEDAQLFARNAAREAGAAAKPIILHQGKESSNFFDALGGIVIIRRGSSKDAGATYMLAGRKHMSHIAFDEVDFSPRSLCSGFPYIVAAASGSRFLWKGKGSGADELGCARLIAMDLGLTGEIEEIDDGSEPAAFWDALSSNEPAAPGGQHWHLKAAKEGYGTRLFAVDDARPKSAGLGAIWGRRPSSTTVADEPSTADIREVAPYAQSDLAQDGIYVLDAYFEVYVILGWRSSARLAAFRSAVLFAQEYAILAASQEDRPFVPAAHVILAGADAPYLKTAFRKWDDRRVTTQPVGSAGDTRSLPLHEAIAALS